MSLAVKLDIVPTIRRMNVLLSRQQRVMMVDVIRLSSDGLESCAKTLLDVANQASQ